MILDGTVLFSCPVHFVILVNISILCQFYKYFNMCLNVGQSWPEKVSVVPVEVKICCWSRLVKKGKMRIANIYCLKHQACSVALVFVLYTCWLQHMYAVYSSIFVFTYIIIVWTQIENVRSKSGCSTMILKRIQNHQTVYGI